MEQPPTVPAPPLPPLPINSPPLPPACPAAPAYPLPINNPAFGCVGVPLLMNTASKVVTGSVGCHGLADPLQS